MRHIDIAIKVLSGELQAANAAVLFNMTEERVNQLLTADWVGHDLVSELSSRARHSQHADINANLCQTARDHEEANKAEDELDEVRAAFHEYLTRKGILQ